ncbi:spore cortex-lytic enzyme [Clostridium thermosuccinogenes]|uniref:spore cortex-lytic enzyme n=2 Tax=Clostridium thermosuccinogenes TaxID=84032 RepID=UPI003BEF37F7
MLLVYLTFSVFTYNKPVIVTPRMELKPGHASAEVEQMQQRLKNWGYYRGIIDGYYGDDTFQAVKEYQKKNNIPVTGIAGFDTLLAMGLTSIAESGAVHAQGKNISDEQLLARAINGEARGEPYEGQVAVGAVILNRTRDARFPKTIAGVIYQPGAFTAVSDGQINVPIDPNSTVVKAARDALNGWDPTNGCLYYWNPATATSKWIWSRKIIKTIGKHHFGI